MSYKYLDITNHGGNLFKNVSKIVTHPRRAHLDETLAIAIILTCLDDPIIVERKNPTNDDLENLSTMVLDCGERFEPKKLNFDHHHLDQPRPVKSDDPIPKCALSLILDHMGIYNMFKYEEWLPLLELSDNYGVTYAEKFFKLEPNSCNKFRSPFESLVLGQISKESIFLSQSKLGQMLRQVGSHILARTAKLQERLQLLSKVTSSYILPTDKEDVSIHVCDNRAIDRNKLPAFGLNIYLQENYADTDVVISQDDGSPNGLSLYQCSKPVTRINFLAIKDEPDVSWVHRNGFLAKVSSVDTARLNQLIMKSITSNEQKL